jgi:hypothetical protein
MSVSAAVGVLRLRTAIRRGRLVIAAEPAALARARARGWLVIDAREAAEALLTAEPTFFRRDDLL